MEDVAQSGTDALGEADAERAALGEAAAGTDGFGPAGAQTLVRTPASADSLAVLPDCAFDNLLVVAARDHPRKLQRGLERDGRNLANVGVVPVVPAAREYDGDLWTTDPVSPDDLTGIGMRFSDAMQYVESGTGWVLIDALGVLLMYADDVRVCRFFQTLTSRVRAKDVRGVYCANPSAVADESYERLLAMCDAERSVE